MEKIKRLLKNISIFGISQFSSKILVFLLLPFYTTYLTTSEYGTVDLFFSTVSLLMPIFTLQIVSAVMRFSIDRTECAEEYLANAFIVITIGFILLLLLLPVFITFNLFGEKLPLFYCLYMGEAIYTLLSYYARGIGNITLVGVSGVFNTIIVVTCNIVFLTIFHLGIDGYLWAYICGYSASALLIFVKVFKRIRKCHFKIEKEKIKEMLSYSIPLAPNNLAWWGVSSANKYIIQGMINGGVLGLYSVALKIPSAISTVQSIISEGLVLSVLEQYNERDDNVDYYSLLYKIYSVFSVFVIAIIIILSKFISEILFAKEFIAASKYVPLLCISPLWGALSGYLGTFYAASKKNKGMFISTMIGAGLSILVSILGIPYLGVYAVIIGNMVAYFSIWLYRWIDVKKIVELKITLYRDIISWICLILLAVAVMLIEDYLILVLLELVLMTLIVICYRDIINIAIRSIKIILHK